MTTIYLASPLGFSNELHTYRKNIRQRLHDLGCTVLDPWEPSYRAAMEHASQLADWPERVKAFRAIAAVIGRANEQMLRECDMVLAVLDGAELDSGTVSEIGFAAGLGKTCHGLRTDFRDCGELDGLPFNLQVLYWIEASGGHLFRRIEDINFD